MSKITVIDAMMGAGKTTWAIDFINNCSDNVWYVAPYLNEVDRIIKSCPDKKIVEPKRSKKTKSESLIDLLESGENIAATHELFKRLDSRSKAFIENNEYILIIDEVIEVVQLFNDIKYGDLQLLLDGGWISIVDGYIV